MDDKNIVWEEVMVSAAKNKDKNIFMIAAKKSLRWKEICTCLLEEFILNDDLEGIDFIYVFYMYAEPKQEERSAFLDYFIPLGKISIFPNILQFDKDILPDFISMVCKYNSKLLLDVLLPHFSSDLKNIKHFMLQSTICNRDKMLSKAISLYDHLISTGVVDNDDGDNDNNDDGDNDNNDDGDTGVDDGDTNDDNKNIYEMLFMISIERDYGKLIDMLYPYIIKLDHCTDIINKAGDTLENMGHKNDYMTLHLIAKYAKT